MLDPGSHLALSASPGPLARTAIELERLRRAAAFRRARELDDRRRLRESDALLEWVEQCRLRSLVLVPTPLWARVVRLVGSVDPVLRDDLGINRRTDHVCDVLFSAQGQLLARHAEDRRRGPAPIIPLFGAGRGPIAVD